MNSFACFGSSLVKGTIDSNSILSVNRSATAITLDSSGTVTGNNLSAIAGYSSTAWGINPTNGNTTFLSLKQNANNLTTPTSNFTFYIKHAERFYIDSIFGHGYTITTSASSVEAGNSFTLSFYSLYPTISLPYSIAGVTSSDLSGASTTGNWTSNYQAISYTVATTFLGSKTFSMQTGTINITLTLSGPYDNLFIVRATEVTKYGPTSSTVYSYSFSNPLLCNFINGNLYICDYAANKVFKMDSTGTISVFAGTGTDGNDCNGGQATAAKISGPSSICGDSVGNFYVSSSGNNQNIRKINSAGIITNLVDSIDARTVQGMVVYNGSLYYCEKWENHCVRKVDLTSLDITTVAGTRGSYGYVDGIATDGRLESPNGVAFDSNSNMYINDYGNSKIRKVTPNGIMSTFLDANCAGGIFIKSDRLFYYSGNSYEIKMVNLSTGIQSTAKTVTYLNGYLAVD
jgi:hypothetical protein